MPPRDSGPLRIGCVKYLNAQPLIFGWPGEVLFDHPASLCRKLADAEIEVACVSSFEFLRNPIYKIADGVAVGADGPVYSVFLVHDEPLEDLRAITLDCASQTSVNLLRCLFAERGMSPTFVADAAPNQSPIGDGRARLMIGDQAIRFRERYAEKHGYWDLGAAWKKATGLPFVFALWLLRPELSDISEIADRLRERRDENLRSLDQVIAAQTEFTPPFCEFYFRSCLRFGFAEPEKAGLLLFRSLCEKHGILPANQTPLRLV